jgi:hypothetical protein
VSLLALPASAQIGNRDRDSTAAFNAALKAAANIVAPGGHGSGTNTCVVVPPTTGGKTGYFISGTIQLRNMFLQSTEVWSGFGSSRTMPPPIFSTSMRRSMVT